MDENMVKLLQERERELYVLGIKRGDTYFKNRWAELCYIMRLLGIERRDTNGLQ